MLLKTDYYEDKSFFFPPLLRHALHLDSRSKSRSSCRAFSEPLSLLGSRGEKGKKRRTRREETGAPSSSHSPFGPADRWLMAISSAHQGAALAQLKQCTAECEANSKLHVIPHPSTPLSAASRYLSLSRSHSTHTLGWTRRQANKTKQSMLFVPPVSPSTVHLDSFFSRRHTKGLTRREDAHSHTHDSTIWIRRWP